MGEQSNTQSFLGALLCLCWLVLVLARRPYDAFWDNVLSGMLSFQLMLILLCGRALEINQLRAETNDDPYERELFSVLVVLFSILIISVAVCVIVVTVPCVRRQAVKLWKRCCGRRNKETPTRPEMLGLSGGGDDDERKWQTNALAMAGSGASVRIEMTRPARKSRRGTSVRL